MKDIETVGMRIRKLRKKRGISQQELADALNVSRVTVTVWEQDRNVPKQLYRLAEVLKTTEGYLLDGIERAGNELDFTREERRLINMYRKLTPTKKQAIYNLAMWLSKED